MKRYFLSENQLKDYIEDLYNHDIQKDELQYLTEKETVEKINSAKLRLVHFKKQILREEWHLLTIISFKGTLAPDKMKFNKLITGSKTQEYNITRTFTSRLNSFYNFSRKSIDPLMVSIKFLRIS